MAPSSAKPRARPEGSGRPTARGNNHAGHCAPFAALTLLETYFRFYNERRPHTAHEGGTPAETYRAREPEAINQ